MKPVRKRSMKQEQDVAKEFDAKTVIASGSLWFADSDVRSEKYLIECKFTDEKYYTLTAHVWEKIRTEAIRDHIRTPLMVIDIQGERFIVFNVEDFDITKVHPYYEVETINLRRSVRLYKDFLSRDRFDSSDYKGILFYIKEKMLDTLFFMRIEIFKAIFEEDI